MERYQELFYLYVLSGELSKNVSLYYDIGRFGKDQQNKSKVTTNTITRPESPVIDLTQQETIPFNFLQEPTQSLETFSTSEPLLINIQDIDISTV